MFHNSRSGGGGGIGDEEAHAAGSGRDMMLGTFMGCRNCYASWLRMHECKKNEIYFFAHSQYHFQSLTNFSTTKKKRRNIKEKKKYFHLIKKQPKKTLVR